MQIFVCKSLLTFAAREPPSLLTMLKSGVVLFLYPNDNQFPKTIQQPGGFGRVAIPKRACFRRQGACLPLHPQHRLLQAKRILLSFPFRAERMSVSFSAAISIRFGHSQTFVKDDTILVLLCGGSLFRDNHYPVTVRMMTVAVFMQCDAGTCSQCYHSHYRHSQFSS